MCMGKEMGKGVPVPATMSMTEQTNTFRTTNKSW